MTLELWEEAGILRENTTEQHTERPEAGFEARAFAMRQEA